MNKYIAKEAIETAIDYFREQDYSKAEQIGLFFYFKAAGMNGDSYVSYKKWGEFSSAEKEKNMRVLYDLAGIFDAKCEVGNKYTALFPFSISRAIKQGSFYNGGSGFKTLGSRISDTLDNSLVSTFIERNAANRDALKFSNGYVSYIKSRLLKDKAISITNLVTWVYRFWEINVPENITDQDLTDALILAFLRDFHVSPDEFTNLLVFSNEPIQFADVAISGGELRSIISITDPQCQPDIQSNATPDYMPLTRSFSQDDIRKLVELRGQQLTRESALHYLQEEELRNKERAKWDSLTDIEKKIVTCYRSEAFNKQPVEEVYSSFQERFGKDAIKQLSGMDLLYTLFGMKAEESLMYCLEHKTGYFGGISLFRWQLYLYQRDGQWISASNPHGTPISESEAVELAEQYRDNFVRLFDYIDSSGSQHKFDSLAGYDELQQNIKSILGANFHARQWVRKYLHMLYPNIFINVYSSDWVAKIFRVAQIIPGKSYYLCCGQLSLLAKKLGIPNVYLYYILRALDDAEKDDDDQDISDDGEFANNEVSGDDTNDFILEEKRVKNGCNVLLYGVPGSGKSWTIEHEYVKDNSKVERLVFHPDYTYSDFVGQILPCVKEGGQVSYQFTPGPFTNILRNAYLNPTEEYILVIEEINRGNAPAIFGEVFQLLDRKIEEGGLGGDYPVGTSEYGITNENIAKCVYGDPTHKIRIPANLSILGTMNTSDQNVFTLDTAFQRRWQMRLIENSFDNVEKAQADAKILDTGITWQNFCTAMNDIIIKNCVRTTSSEDKRLGVYFIHHRDLKFDDRMGSLASGEYDGLRVKERDKTISDEERIRLSTIRTAIKQNRIFPEKVIKYLWDDAFKYNREAIFEYGTYASLEAVIHKFMYSDKEERFSIFISSVREAIAKGSI